MMPIDLHAHLKKCCIEESIETQPLYIDGVDECIKCTWCHVWSGSQKVKRINQHYKRDKCHAKAHMRAKGYSESDSHGMRDIRDFFSR